MLALSNGVFERAITETGSFAKEDEIRGVDRVFVRVKTGEDAIANVDSDRKSVV